MRFPKNRRTLTGFLAAVLIGFLVACSPGGSSGQTGSGSSSGGSTSQTDDASSDHRVTHSSGFVYPGSRRTDDQLSITEPRPHVDFPEINDFKCSTSGAPSATSIIKNTTSTTNDYSVRADFFRNSERIVGDIYASTYVQVYDVKPGEEVKFTTKELEGESHTVTPDSVCSPMTLERILSKGQAAAVPSQWSVPPSEPAPDCSLLSADEVAKEIGSPVTLTTEYGPCEYQADQGFSLAMNPNQSQPDPNAETYGEPLREPFLGCTMGLMGPDIVLAQCLVKDQGFTFTARALSGTNLERPQIDAVARLINLAMSRV
jgi:hypothetical protein